MPMSPARGPLALFAPLVFLAALSSSCAAEQPVECEAYLACFYPPGEPSAYAGDPERAELADEGTRLYALYGSEGECWRNGEGDPVYATCQKACLGALVDECERESAISGSGTCIEDVGGELSFTPAVDPSLSQPCATLAGG